MKLLKLLLVLLPAVTSACNGNGASGLAPKTEADRVAVKRLNQRFLSTELEHVALTEVIEFLRNASDVNIYVHWAALKANGLDRSTPVNLDIRDATPYEALITLLGSLESEEPITCELADGVVLISTSEDAKGLVRSLNTPPPIRGGRTHKHYIIERLNERIREIDFDDVKLEDVLQFLRDVSGMSSYVSWSALHASGLKKSTVVDMHLRNVTLHTALLLALASGSPAPAVGYSVENALIHIPASRTPRFPPLPPAHTKEDRHVRKTLSKTIRELTFDDVELEDVLQFLRDVSGQNIYVYWAELELAGIDKGTLVNIYLDDVSFHHALMVCLTDAAGENAVGYIIKDGRIHVSTPEGLKKLREAPSQPRIAPRNQ